MEDEESLPTQEDLDNAAKQASEQQGVCRFFMRGSCTWGIDCRFLHPAPPNNTGMGNPRFILVNF